MHIILDGILCYEIFDTDGVFVKSDQEERWHMFRGSTLYASNIWMALWLLGGVGYALLAICLFDISLL